MSTRAKFTCHKIEVDAHGRTVHLGVVYDTDVQKENGRFTKATPSGTIQMRVDNPEAAVQFQPGKSYYVDFHEVPGLPG